jgi:hypothetical protein
MEENELFGKAHEQEENGLFGRRHEAEQLILSGVVDSEAKLCGKSNCHMEKLDGNVYCSYHYDVNFG